MSPRPVDQPAADQPVDPAEEAMEDIAVGFADGPVTFTRPGVESETFTVKDGKISTTKAKRDWLREHVVGLAAE